ncbi:hypothetical protein ACIRQY_32145 [Streptomyces sp. NPDC101490]|uniref:hypothetical protein n=1 Tax=Streptomyces sp. NPDC101490 TaxID=3366143 RepID=UPI0037FE2B5A
MKRGKRPDGGRAPRRAFWPRTLIAVMACGVVIGGLTAWRAFSTDTVTDRPVTTEEASRLALSRLGLYQASPVAVRLTAAEGGDVVVRVRGVVDYRNHRAVGRYQVSGASGASPRPGTQGPSSGQLDQGLIVWDGGGLGLAPAHQDDGSPFWEQAERIPRSGWSARSYTSDPLDAGLQLMIGLGADRPDNPLLLAQSGARWLARERVDGRDHDRFAGPRARGAAPGPGSDGGRSPLTYWVDGDGGLRRVTMRMPGLGVPTTLEFLGHDSRARLPEAPWATR